MLISYTIAPIVPKEIEKVILAKTIPTISKPASK